MSEAFYASAHITSLELRRSEGADWGARNAHRFGQVIIVSIFRHTRCVIAKAAAEVSGSFGSSCKTLGGMGFDVPHGAWPRNQ